MSKDLETKETNIETKEIKTPPQLPNLLRDSQGKIADLQLRKPYITPPEDNLQKVRLKFLEKLKLNNPQDATSIDLSAIRVIDDKMLDLITSHFTNLEKLDLSNRFDLRAEGLKYLQRLENLKDLDLEFCSKLNSSKAFSLLKLKNLEKINLTNCHNIDDSFLEIISKIKSLEEITLNNCNGISVSGVAKLLENLPVKIISLKNCKNIEKKYQAKFTSDPELLESSAGKIDDLSKDLSYVRMGIKKEHLIKSISKKNKHYITKPLIIPEKIVEESIAEIEEDLISNKNTEDSDDENEIYENDVDSRLSTKSESKLEPMDISSPSLSTRNIAIKIASPSLSSINMAMEIASPLFNSDKEFFPEIEELCEILPPASLSFLNLSPKSCLKTDSEPLSMDISSPIISTKNLSIKKECEPAIEKHFDLLFIPEQISVPKPSPLKASAMSIPQKESQARRSSLKYSAMSIPPKESQARSSSF